MDVGVYFVAPERGGGGSGLYAAVGEVPKKNVQVPPILGEEAVLRIESSFAGRLWFGDWSLRNLSFFFFHPPRFGISIHPRHVMPFRCLPQCLSSCFVPFRYAIEQEENTAPPPIVSPRPIRSRIVESG